MDYHFKSPIKQINITKKKKKKAKGRVDNSQVFNDCILKVTNKLIKLCYVYKTISQFKNKTVWLASVSFSVPASNKDPVIP